MCIHIFLYIFMGRVRKRKRNGKRVRKQRRKWVRESAGYVDVLLKTSICPLSLASHMQADGIRSKEPIVLGGIYIGTHHLKSQTFTKNGKKAHTSDKWEKKVSAIHSSSSSKSKKKAEKIQREIKKEEERRRGAERVKSLKRKYTIDGSWRSSVHSRIILRCSAALLRLVLLLHFFLFLFIYLLFLYWFCYFARDSTIRAHL